MIEEYCARNEDPPQIINVELTDSESYDDSAISRGGVREKDRD